MNIRRSHMPELSLRPLRRFREVRRAGKARSNAIEQPAGVFHNVRVIQTFVADARDRIEIKRFNGRLCWRRCSFGFLRRERGEAQGKYRSNDFHGGLR